MERLNGSENFTSGGLSAGFSVLDFWKWADSDLYNNISRGVLAEFLVYSSLIPGCDDARKGWSPCDVISPSGRRIEVKSAAYLQSWSDEDLSQISFDIAPKRTWDPESGYSPFAQRNCDLYVFALYTATSRSQSPLDLDLWDFYLLSAAVLNDRVPEQKHITLPSLLRFEPLKVGYPSLGDSIETLNLKRM